jgi:hypothetical protein
MPCDQRITNTVEFKEGTDPELLKAALEAAGFRTYDYLGGIGFTHNTDYRLGGKFNKGVFTVTEGTDTNAIKRQYSIASVKATAKKFGWTVKQDQKNPLKMQVIKRS